MNEFEKNFIERIKESNAEEIRNRLLARVEIIIKEAGLSEKRLSQVDIDVTDFLKTPNQ